MSKRPEIEIVSGALAGRRFAVPPGGLRLGRSSSNDVHVPDEELSRNHCLFEAVGDDGVRVTDLASANGTFVNGRQLGDGPAALRPGDLVEVGTTDRRVVGEGAPAAPADSVDLGLGARPGAAGQGGDADESMRRARRAKSLRIVSAVIVLAALASVFLPPVFTARQETVIREPPQEDMSVREFAYEKVEADSGHIFRYALSLSDDGVLRVVVDNVPGEGRHVEKSQKLDGAALAELGDILSHSALEGVSRRYEDVDPGAAELRSWRLRVVYASRVRTVRIVNAEEPDAFRAIRERLETFSQNQLGVWALPQSRERLVAMAEEALAVARARWDDREVQHGNLYASMKKFEETLYYLETVKPKPEFAAEAKKGLEDAKAELRRRYDEQRFLADRAIDLQQWEEAKRELQTLLELVPDRSDERHREASAKLVDVERRVKGGK